MMKLVAEKMTVSKINTVISCDIQKVWGIVTSVENYTWRSDLSKLEVLDETWFIEYTKNGYPTFFTVTCSEPFMCWEFDMENSNMRGHWVGLFTGRKQETEIEFTEYVSVKKKNIRLCLFQTWKRKYFVRKVCKMEYRVNDTKLTASVFIPFANQIWQGSYDMELTQEALSKTLNITAYDGDLLAGCLRILTDGYFFGTITELLVLPKYQKQGIGSKLLALAKENTPTMLYFGAQPGAELFYEKNGCGKSLQSYMIDKK